MLQRKVLQKASLSQSLKKAIKEQRYVFSEKDLLALTAQYVFDLKERLPLYDLFATQASAKEIRAWAKQIKKYEEKQFTAFTTLGENEIFVIFPWGDDDFNVFFLSRDFNGIFPALSKQNRQYTNGFLSAHMTPFNAVSVYKSKIGDLSSTMAPSVTLSAKSVMKLYTDLRNEWGNRSKKESILSAVISFPAFLKQGDLVRYVSDRYGDHGKYRYGIIGYAPTDDYACIEELDQDEVRRRTCHIADEKGYYPCLMNHCHIDYPYIEKIDPSCLSEKEKEDYEYYLKFLQEKVFA